MADEGPAVALAFVIDFDVASVAPAFSLPAGRQGRQPLLEAFSICFYSRPAKVVACECGSDHGKRGAASRTRPTQKNLERGMA